MTVTTIAARVSGRFRKIWRPENIWFFIFSAFASLTGKCLLATLGSRFDMVSWMKTADLVVAHKNVYESFENYNYGPAWMLILGCLRRLADAFPLINGTENFHVWVALLLSIIDIFLAATLRSLRYYSASILFLWSPALWIVSGYLCQFDHFAIFFGLLATIAFYQNRMLWAGLLLGLSLVIKHDLFLLPVWLLFWRFPSKKWLKKTLTVACTPYLIFILSFLPWATTAAGRAGIWRKVFNYQRETESNVITGLLAAVGALLPLETSLSWIPLFSGYKILWILLMLLFGWLFRKREPLDLLLLYLVALTSLSPGVWAHYLVIPLLAGIFYRRSPALQAYAFLRLVYLGAFLTLRLPWQTNLPIQAIARFIYEWPIGTPNIFLLFFLAAEVKMRRVDPVTQKLSL